MQTLLASLAIGLQVKDSAYKAGMATARAEAKKTGQSFDAEGSRMADAMQTAARGVNKALVSVGEQMAKVSQQVQRSGVVLTAAVTAPLVVAGAKVRNAAAEFQSAMNKVHSAMLEASPEQLDKLGDAAMTLGPKFGRGAAEAAGAIEMLAKNGMSAAAILNGGLTSALTLATMGETDLESAANATTDIMAQFGKTSADLPDVVNKIAGALDKSKMGFDDYRLAIGQAGGVAGSLPVTFDDLNVALAATASQFASGSDAGTSFKTFLTSLDGNSKEARETITKYGLSFFDAQGHVRGLGEIAEELRSKLGDLNSEARVGALKKIFGTDAYRTGVGLIAQGAKGIEDLRKSIAGVTAESKLAALMQGDADATRRLSAAIDTLSIRLGQVLLPIFTQLKDAAATAVQWLADLPPAFHYAWGGAGAFAASLGPLILVASTLAKVTLPMLAARFGPIAIGLAALINPIGLVVAGLGRLAMAAGAQTAVGLLGARMMALAGPIGIVAAVLTMLVPLLFRTATASAALTKAQDAANARSAKAAELTQQLATATGKLREEIRKKAAMDALEAKRAIDVAKANMLAAKTALARARAEAVALNEAARFSGGSAAGPGTGAVMRGQGEQNVAQALANLAAANGVLDTELKTFRANMDTFKAASDGGATTGLPAGEDEKKDRSKTGRDASRDQDRFDDELGQLRVARLRAYADLTGGIEAQYKATMAEIDEDRAAFVRQINADEGLNAAKRVQLLAAKDAELAERRQIAERDQTTALEQERFDLFAARNDAEQELARSVADVADSMRGRREAELHLLDLQRQREEAEIDLILATKATSSAEWENARRRKEALGGVYKRRAEQIVRDTETPAERYMRELKRSAAAIGEDIEAGAVSALDRLNDELADAVMGAGSLAKAFANMAQSIVRDLIRIGIQRAIIAPLADTLFGAAGENGERSSGGGLLGSFTAALGGVLGLPGRTPGYGGGKAYGGRWRLRDRPSQGADRSRAERVQAAQGRHEASPRVGRGKG